MKKLFIFLLTAYVCFLNVNAQDVLLERDLSESVYLKKKGPNKDKFMHLYFDFASYSSLNDDNSAYEDWGSFRSYVGLRKYYRLANSYIMGLSIEYGWERFKVEQDFNDLEVFGTSNIGMEYFNRLLITQRESSLGYWIDAAVYTNFNLNSRHMTKYKDYPDHVRSIKQIVKGLDMLNKWEYGLKARFGFKRYALVGTYRLSDWMNSSSYGEPQRFSIGVELGIY
jgi:hypothetical protein